MPTYVQKDTNSDLTPFAEFNKELSAGTGTDAGLTVSGLNPGSPVTGGFITPADVPNSDQWEDSGTWTVEVEVDTGNMQVDCRVRCVRLDSSGTVLQSGAYTATQVLNASRTFSPVAPAWTDGEEACANRLAVELEFSAGAGMNQSVTIGLGTTANEVVTDVTEDAGACVGATKTLTGSLEAVLAAVRSVDAGLAAALRDTLSRQLGLDAGVAAGRSGDTALDSALAQRQAATAAAEAALRKGRIASALTDAAIRVEVQRQAGLTAALALARAGVTNLEAALRKTETPGTGLDAALEAAQSATATLDAALAREIGVATAIQAALRALVTVATGLDASISEISLRTATASLAAAVRATLIAGAALDAALQVARETSAQADAALAGTALLGAGLDASLDLPFAPAGTRTFGHGEDRDRVITAGGRTFVVPAGNRKH